MKERIRILKSGGFLGFCSYLHILSRQILLLVCLQHVLGQISTSLAGDFSALDLNIQLPTETFICALEDLDLCVFLSSPYRFLGAYLHPFSWSPESASLQTAGC